MRSFSCRGSDTGARSTDDGLAGMNESDTAKQPGVTQRKAARETRSLWRSERSTKSATTRAVQREALLEGRGPNGSTRQKPVQTEERRQRPLDLAHDGGVEAAERPSGFRARQRDRPVNHHLRGLAQAVFRRRLDRDPELGQSCNSLVRGSTARPLNSENTSA